MARSLALRTRVAIASPGLSLYPGLAVSLFLLVLAGAVFTAIITTGLQQDTPLAFDGVARLLAFTVAQATASTLLSLLLGTVLAWSLSHRRAFRLRRVLLALLSVSMVLPTIVTALGLISVLGSNGWINQIFHAITGHGSGFSIYGIAGILIAHTWLNAPFVARGLLHRLEAVPVERFKLAASLRITPWQRFKIVEWPVLATVMPGLTTTVFLLCFTSFSIVLILGGSPNFNTLEVAIYEAVKLEFDLTRAALLALVQLGVCGFLVMIAASLPQRSSAISPPSYFFTWPDPIVARTLQTGTILFSAVLLIAPISAVVVDGLRGDIFKILQDGLFHQALGTSLAVAGLSSVLTIGCALSIAATLRNLGSPLRTRQSRRSWLAGWLISFIGTGYLAMPSIVLGVGFFMIFQNLPIATEHLAPLVLILANVLMALPFGLVVFTPALQKSARRYDKLAFSLNIRGLARWRLIDWPTLRQEIGFVSALSFCLSLGDFGVIALFGNRDFTTLPWLMYQKFGSYRTLDASVVALILLLLVVSVFLFLPVLFEKRGHARS